MYVVEDVDKEHFEMKEEIDMQSREDPCVPIVIDRKGNLYYLRGLLRSATANWDRNWRR